MYSVHYRGNQKYGKDNSREKWKIWVFLDNEEKDMKLTLVCWSIRDDATVCNVEQ